VMCKTGEYDCEYTRPVLAVSTRQEAEEEVLRLNGCVRNYCQRISRLMDKIESRAMFLADKEHSAEEDRDKWSSVFDSVYDNLYGKLREKYPTLTGDCDESTSWYYYEKCEFKGD